MFIIFFVSFISDQIDTEVHNRVTMEPSHVEVPKYANSANVTECK